MKATVVPLRATTLTPFAYHSLMVQDGTATLPELIGDRALAFALASTLGWMAARVVLPPKDYRRHLAALPYRTSLLTTDAPRLLPPLTRRLNLDGEAGMQKKLNDVTSKGNLKTFFHIQEVPPGQTFRGAIFGLDPFTTAGEKTLVIRIGLHRGGMVKLERADRGEVQAVRLNAATAALFGRELEVHRYCLHHLQLTQPLGVQEAMEEVEQWQ